MFQRFLVRSFIVALVVVGLLSAGTLQARAEDGALTERVGKLEQKVEEMGKLPGLNVGGFRFLPYGYVKVDAVYDSARAFNGDFMAWVLQETENPTNLASQATPDQHEFSMTANQSRLDLKVIAPDYGEIKTYGLFEIDFYGQLTSNTLGVFDNKPAILVRHAFIEMHKGSWGLLVGQTSDPISLQVEDTWNYFVGWMAGNPGYRRPQIRIMKDFALPDGSKLAVWAGAMRTIESTGLVTAGEDTGFPTTFGRVTYTRPMLGKELLFSVNGHFGKEDANNATGGGGPTITPGAISNRVKSWSVNVEAIVPLPAGFWLKGEAFQGAVMGNYFGGIGQSTSTLGDEIVGVRTRGFWAQLGWVVNDKLRFHVGGSVDDPFKDDLTATTVSGGAVTAGGRSLNRQFYANFMWNVTPSFVTGYEIMQALTQYKEGPDGNDLRHQVSFMYKF
jgi:hypothetical protein